MSTEVKPAFLNISDAARYLGVSRDVMRRMIDDGKVQAVRIGPATVRVSIASLDALGNNGRDRVEG